MILGFSIPPKGKLGGNTISSSGTLALTRLSVFGPSNRITGGNIQSGCSGTSQRGLLIGNGSSGVLTITGGTLTTNGTVAANVDVLGNNVTTGDGTLIIDGGSYVASGLGTLSLGNGSANGGNGTLTLTSGSATVNTLAYNTATSGTKSSAIVNLDGGTLTISNITVTSGLTKQFNFNGGQFIAAANLPAFSGLTMNVKNGGAKINTNGFSFSIGNALLNNGTGGLTKSGSGTLTLAGANTYAGATTITGGTLALGASNALPGTAVAIGTGTLNAATFTDTVGAMELTGSAVINLGAGAVLAFADSSLTSWASGTLTITGTFVSGSSLRFGTISSGGLTSTQLSKISATGFTGFALNSSGYLIAIPDGFASWITGTFANGQVPTNQRGPNDDFDNDGIRNLLEYAIAGQDPTVSNATVGTFNGTTLSFSKRAGTTGLTYTIEKSTDLGITDAWAAVTGVPPVYVNDGSIISYTLTPGSPVNTFLRLRVFSN